MAEGIPVRGGAGEIIKPSAFVRRWEIGCGGANAIPAAKRFGQARALIVTRPIAGLPFGVKFLRVVCIHFHKAARREDGAGNVVPLRLNAFKPTPVKGGNSIAISNGASEFP
jgi:hypothetical protein